MRLVIEGEPIPAARPRFSGRRTYQPKRNVEYRRRVQEIARAAMDGLEPMRGEIVIEVQLYRKYKRTARIYGDVDNHLKALFDGMSGILFVDDSQIVRCVVEKHTDKTNPRTEIKLKELKVVA
ncbi:MAG: RusA family crossover junction endodeoxyribonuclease [Selenomonadaceae bacterium]|nr:RusA family crossover junction endodeoxyribonuclease [Selenomonadaceae bacterium]